jgi:stage V sporulation protein AA
MDAVGSIVAFQDGIMSSTRISMLQAIELIHSKLPEVGVYPLGETSALFEPANPRPQSPVITAIKLIVTVLLFFIGSGLAVMYFHSDVNMKETHRIIHHMISGENSERPLLLSLSYSIGIGLGIALFFDVFSLGRKKQNPGPLELELYQTEKELEDYLINLEAARKENE